jgi:hypothetical protein
MGLAQRVARAAAADTSWLDTGAHKRAARSLAPSELLSVVTMNVEEAARFFRQRYKGHALGPFTNPRASDIDNAKRRGEFFELPGACCIARKLKQARTLVDFAGDTIIVPQGDIYIEDIAAENVVAAKALLEHVFVSIAAPDLWVNIFEEDDAMRATMDGAQLEYCTTRVTAYAEVIGVYSTSVVASTYTLRAEDVPGLLRLNAGYLNNEELRNIWIELAAQAPWAEHYSKYNKGGKSWSAFALRGYKSDDPGFIEKPSEMSPEWKRENAEALRFECYDTVLAKAFPMTMTYVQALPGRKQRVRFMKLRSKGGELQRHTDIQDKEAGTRNAKVSRLHIPIVTDGSVEFNMWGTRGELQRERMREGELWYLDMRKPHRAINNGETERIHLVIDVYGTQELRSWLAR